MWSVAGVGEYPDARQRHGEGHLRLVLLVLGGEHLLAVAAELLACRDETLLGLSLLGEDIMYGI